MDLLVLGGALPLASAVYRGTDRETPYYVEGVGDEHPANQAFFWYCREGGQLGVVHDLGKAQELVEAYRRLAPPQYFEIIEVTTGKEARPATNSEFLGYDLSAGYHYSLLSWGLDISGEPRSDLPKDDLLWSLQPLFRLIQVFFQPQLNARGLFDEYVTASFCLQCMMALQKVRPNLWENEDVTFEVVGLWKVVSV